MKDRAQENLRRIDELWGIHEHRDEDALIEGHCLAFVIDRRYVPSSGDDELQIRIGVNFGHNPFTPEMKTGFVPPPVLPGRLVFGLHLVATKGNQLTIYGEWMSPRKAGDIEDPARAAEQAREILASMDDEGISGKPGIRTTMARSGPRLPYTSRISRS